jgi:lysine-specific demethylase 3
MYNANANRVAFGTKGSTRLHMDMADALNLMTYAAPDADGKDGCAAWDLFRAQDSDKIRQFMREKFVLTGLDPIHLQQIYLDDEARRLLWEEYDVKSYRVYQKAGEAVFIPAGCAHQVRNLSDCIKVFDFSAVSGSFLIFFPQKRSRLTLCHRRTSRGARSSRKSSGR